MAAGPLRELAERLQGCCLQPDSRLLVATAESCTGGLIADAITDVAGSSEYFVGGIVSYSNVVKRALLDVPEALLQAHGAVSAQVARAMATGALARTGADVAVAVTGIAGPGGGSPSKPVGLTYVGVADAAGVDVRRFLWDGDRAANKESSARAALEMLVERCEARREAEHAAGSDAAAGGTPSRAEERR